MIRNLTTCGLLISLITLSSHVFAGVHIGNGGDVVACGEGASVQYELLDFYEARTLRDIPLDLGAPTLTTADKVALALSRLAKVDPLRSQRYQNWAQGFDHDTKFLSAVVLVDVPDSEHPSLPEGCRIEQVAIHREPLFPQDRRYTVNKDIWDHLDNDNRAGLMLHEMIYREADGFNIENSIGVRYINSLIFSGLMDQTSVPEYVSFLEKVGFGTASIAGLWVDLFKQAPSFYPNGQLEQAWVFGNQRLATPWGAITTRCKIAYFEDGALSAFNLGIFDRIIIPAGGRELTIDSQSGPNDSCETTFRGHRAEYDVYFEEPNKLHTANISWSNPVTLTGEGFALGMAGITSFDAAGRIIESLSMENLGSFQPAAKIEGVTCSLGLGVVKLIGEIPTTLFLLPCSVTMPAGGIKVFSGSNVLYDAGNFHLLSSHLDDGPRAYMTIQGGRIQLHPAREPNDPGGFVAFFPNGALRQATLFQHADFTFTDHHIETLYDLTTIILSEEGLVEHFWRN